LTLRQQQRDSGNILRLKLGQQKTIEVHAILRPLL